MNNQFHLKINELEIDEILLDRAKITKIIGGREINGFEQLQIFLTEVLGFPEGSVRSFEVR